MTTFREVKRVLHTKLGHRDAVLIEHKDGSEEVIVSTDTMSGIPATRAIDAYYQAVDRRMAEIPDLPRSDQRRLRQWLAKEVKEFIGIDRLEQMTNEHLDDVIKAVHCYRRNPEAVHGGPPCDCHWCQELNPELVEKMHDSA